jgi:uncharacterized protein YjbI with pentapeptide repeats
MKDFEPHFQREKEQLAKLIEEVKAPSAPEDPSALMKTLLSEQGLSPERIASVEQALEMPLPLRGAFETEAQFDSALAQYGSKWSTLLGLPASNGPMIAQQLKLSSLASQGNPEEAIKGLFNFLPPDQAQALSKDFLTDAGPQGTVKSLSENLSKLGLNSAQIDQFQASLQTMDKTAETPGLSLADRVKSLKESSGQMELALGLPAGTSEKQIDDKVNLSKRLVWGDEDLGKDLDQLAESNPQLTPNLASLHKLRTSPDLKPFNSLPEIAVAAGVTERALLAKIALLDKLNPVPIKLEKPAPEPEPEPIPEEPAPPQKPPAFTTRQDVENCLKDSDVPNRLAGLSLAGLNLSELDFSALDLTGTDFRECNLTGAKFNGSNLTEALLQGAALDRVSAVKADFTRANLTEIKAKGADFSQSLFPSADLSLSDLSQANLTDIKAKQAAFTSTIFPASLKGVNLTLSAFRKVSLKGVNLEQSDLSQADFTCCDLSEASLKQANLTGASMVETLLQNTDFSGGKAMGAKFLQGCDLTGVNFTKAELTGASFTGSKAPKAKFKAVTAGGAILGGIDLTGSNFAGSYLRQANFFRSDLSGADFHGADLFKAVFGGADLKSTDFTGASLYGADLYRISIDDKTRFKEADLNSTCLILNGKQVV